MNASDAPARAASPAAPADTSSGAARGYPRKRARTRRALLNAGRAELAEHGPDGATVGEVARRAHVSTGTFYNHFHDLDTLLQTVVDELAQAVETARDQLIAIEPDPAARLAVGTLQCLGLTRDDRATALAFVGLLANVAAFRSRVRATVARLIIDGVSSGRFEPRPHVVTTDALIGAVVQWMRTRLDGNDLDSSDSDCVSLALHIVGLARSDVDHVVERFLDGPVARQATTAVG